MSAKDSFRCACNDNAFQIISPRKVETWQNAAFWCSGTLSMLNYDGSTKYVWNPYSLMELENILYEENKMQIYLECIATGGSCTAPTSNVFVQQQVNSVFFLLVKI
jgi:hypothetical protein